MSEYIPTATKTYRGKRYVLLTVEDTKAKAEARIGKVKKNAFIANAFALKIPKTPKGKAGYNRARWAVYARP